MTTDRTPILGLAARQFGLFTTTQAMERGLSVRMLQHLASTSGIARIDRGVWAIRGAPETIEQRALSAVLRHGPGAALCRSSAAWLWRLPTRLPEPFDVVRARGERP